MNGNEIALSMISDSGKTMPELSRSMERERTYLITTIGRGRIPRTDTMAKIADVCGYDLLVRRRSDGYETIIDPYDD